MIWFLLERRMNCQNIFLRKFYTVLINYLLNKKASFIGARAEFSGKPIFPHGINGILVSNKAKIGKNVVIFHQVTIGSNNLSDSNKNGAPTIGDNCYIGAGAKIIGNIKVGNNVRVGANAVVVKDVPDNSVVVNQPSRVIQKNIKLDNDFVNI
jgi:serine O-acetyltransferase